MVSGVEQDLGRLGHAHWGERRRQGAAAALPGSLSPAGLERLPHARAPAPWRRTAGVRRSLNCPLDAVSLANSNPVDPAPPLPAVPNPDAQPHAGPKHESRPLFERRRQAPELRRRPPQAGCLMRCAPTLAPPPCASCAAAALRLGCDPCAVCALGARCGLYKASPSWLRKRPVPGRPPGEGALRTFGCPLACRRRRRLPRAPDSLGCLQARRLPSLPQAEFVRPVIAHRSLFLDGAARCLVQRGTQGQHSSRPGTRRPAPSPPPPES
jgi:hypothetical protein